MIKKYLLMTLVFVALITITGYCVYQFYVMGNVIYFWAWVFWLIIFSAGYALCER